MIDVVCFCGHRYSVSGDAGACPQCGEGVSLYHPAAATRAVHDEQRLLVTRRDAASQSEEMAA
jgi:hypothetical protein